MKGSDEGMLMGEGMLMRRGKVERQRNLASPFEFTSASTASTRRAWRIATTMANNAHDSIAATRRSTDDGSRRSSRTVASS